MKNKIRTTILIDEELYLMVKRFPKRITLTYLANKGIKHFFDYIASHPEYKDPDIPKEEWEIFVNNVKNYLKKPLQPIV